VTALLIPLLSLLAQAETQPVPVAPALPPELATVAEKTAYAETGRYEEVDRLCHALGERFPDKARCFPFGQTPEGRPLWALVVHGGGALTAEKAHAAGVPVLCAVAGTHAGEIDGKDAGLQFLRDRLLHGMGELEDVALLLVPVFNADGHELRGRHRRPNQAGPLEQGARVTARRINLNRDYTMADAVEMRAMLELLQAWDPLVLLDLHVTDGAKYQHDVSLSVAPSHHGMPGLAKLAAGLEQEAVAGLFALGHLPLPFYPQWLDKNEPLKGLVLDVDPPRHAHAYWGLRNRFGVLVENHSWKPYAARVKTARDTLSVFAAYVARERKALRAAAAAADADSAKLGGVKVRLDVETVTSRPSRTLQFLGYKHTLLQDAQPFGGPGLVYDDTSPETWTLPVYGEVRTAREHEAVLPRGGYLVPAAWAEDVGRRLRLHGVQYRTFARGLSGAEVEVQRIRPEDLQFDEAPFQGKQMLHTRGEWRREVVDVAPGALFVPISQARGLLSAHLLEPGAPDSFSAWGLFNAAYEVNDYTAEYRELELARWMAAGDARIRELYGEPLFSRLPQLQRAFQKRLADDPVFARSPADRKAWWMAHVPPQDPELNRYPVFRVDAPLP